MLGVSTTKQMNRGFRNRSARWLAVSAAAVLGCGGTGGPQPAGPAVPEVEPTTFSFRALDQAYGISRGIEIGLLRDGETLHFRAVNVATGKPLPGVRVFIGEREIVESEGLFAVPISRSLVEKNPEFRIFQPASFTGEAELHSSFTFSLSCHGLGARQVSVSRWHQTPVGPDMLLEEAPLDTAERTRRIALLAQERQFLRGLVGAEPPPITIAVSRAPRVDGTRVEGDVSGRTVWLYGIDQGGDNYLLANVVHEWGHGVMRAAGLPSLGALRYVEDGLVELLAHLAEQQIRRVGPTITAVGRARDLAQHSERTIDLFALGEEFHSINIVEFVEKHCAGDASFGYAVALGFWLEWMGDDPARITALVRAIREQRPRSAKDVEHLIAKLGPVGLNPRAVSVTRARAAVDAAARDDRRDR